jgi:hypothetical protein
MREKPNAFEDVPRHARGHLGLLFYAAAFHLIYYLRCRAETDEKPFDEVLSEHPFLAAYFSQIRSRLPEEIGWNESLAWLREEILNWENADGATLPLVALREGLSLPFTATLVFVLAGAAEEQADFGDLFASLQVGQGQSRATVGLVQQVFESDESADTWGLIRPLIESGFIQVVNRDAPRSGWVLRVPSVLWAAARGDVTEAPLDQARHHPASLLEPLAEMLIEEKVRTQLVELTTLAATTRVRTIVVRGMPGTDRLGTVGAIARALDCGVMEMECAANSGAGVPSSSPLADARWLLLGPLCTLTRSIPVMSIEAGPGEIFELPALAGYAGPVAVIIGLDGGVKTQDAAHAVTIHLDLEPPAHRLELWKRALKNSNGDSQTNDEAASTNLAQIASTYCLPGRYIRQCAALATHYAAMERREAITVADVRMAARAMNLQVLDTLATRIDGGATWTQLIVKHATGRELEVLEQRCRLREQLASTFQGTMPGGMNRGVRALFEGPSGTGKTLAARVLATELGLDLYRVDLAALVNKFVGETEKNVSRVLSRAEDLNVILLLDEGDSLMARRTDVKSANDRYANLETNYLLQRLEHYTGIVVVTTNAGQSIDSAFRRRMDSVVKFHLPDTNERWRLWQAHLPQNHAVDGAALDEIARRYELTGGQIRNVCVNAALAALSGGDGRLHLAQLRGALQAEHRKAGATFIDSGMAAMAYNPTRIAAFLGGLS